MSINKKLLNKTASATVENTFNVKLYTGNRPSNVTVNTFGFSPDLVAIKDRDNADHWTVMDTTRGQNLIGFNMTGAQEDFSGGFEWTSGGFIVKNTGQANTNGANLVAWGWYANGGTTSSNGDGNITSTVQANTDAGFSIVKYSGTGSNVQVGHGLGAAPTMVIFKNLTDSVNWYVWTTATGSLARLEGINTNSAAVTSGLGTTLGASTIDFTNTSDFSSSGKDYIMYCFRDVTGYSKISSYTGTGSALSITGLGFQPSFILLKCLDSTEQWYIFDSARGADKFLHPNLNNAEGTDATTRLTSFDADGFSLGTDGAVNASGDDYMYMAIKINVS